MEEYVEEGSDGDESSEGELEFKSEHRFQNGAIYKGGWKNGKRHGEGSQIWPDGARYEGFWRKNKAHGKGKFWHVDGDIFEGEWRDDKANGHGKLGIAEFYRDLHPHERSEV